MIAQGPFPAIHGLGLCRAFPVCLLLFFAGLGAAQDLNDGIVTGYVVLGKSPESCQAIVDNHSMQSALNGIRLRVRGTGRLNPDVITGPNGEFSTYPLRITDVKLDLADSESAKYREWIQAAATLVSGTGAQAQTVPICLLALPPTPGPDAGAAFRPKSKTGTTPGTTPPGGGFLYFVDPASQSGNSPNDSAPWNGKDINGLISPPRGASGEAARITIRGIPNDSHSAAPEAEVIQKAEASASGEFSLSLVDTVRYRELSLSISLPGFEPASTGLTEAFTTGKTSPTGSLEFEVKLKELQLPPAVVPIYRDDTASRAEFYAGDLLNLPERGGRSLDFFALLAPGILPAPQAGGLGGPGISPGVGTAGQFSANGLRARGNAFTIDLSDDNDEEVGSRRQGFVFPAPLTLEAVSEFQVITALPDARYGRGYGAQVNGFSASGSSRIHLTAYSLGADDMWNARNFFDRAWGTGPATYPVTSATFRPALVANLSRITGTDGVSPFGTYGPFQPLTVTNPTLANPENWHNRTGLAASGPLDRRPLHTAFWSFAYEHAITNDLRQEHFAVPTLDERGFWRSGSSGLNLSGGPSTPANGSGNAIFSLFPFPNNPGGPYGPNTYTEALSANSSGSLVSAGVDYNFKVELAQQLNLKYSFGDEASTLPAIGGALYSSIRPRNRNQMASAGLTTSLPRAWLNTFRVSFGSTNGDYQQSVPDPALVPSVQFPSTPFLLNRPVLANITLPSSPNPEFLALGETTENYTGPIGQVNVLGYSPLGVDVSRFPQKRGDHTLQFGEIVSHVFQGGGRSHQLTFGTQIWSLGFDDTVNRNELPTAVFAGARVNTPTPGGNPFSSSSTQPLVPGDPSSQNPFLLPTDMVAAGIQSAYYQTLATPQTFGRNGQIQALNLKRKQLDFFVNDVWSLTPNFKLSVGFRLEVNREPEDEAGQFQSIYDSNALASQKGAFLSQCENGFAKSSGGSGGSSGAVAAANYCLSYFNYIGQALPPSYSQVFGVNPLGKDVRLGFAWSPKGRTDTVIRGGWGAYTGQFPDIILSETSSYFPAFLPLRFDFSPPQGQLLNGLQRLSIIQPGTLNEISPSLPGSSAATQSPLFELAGSSLGTLGNLGAVLVPTQLAGGLHNPYSRQFGVTVERQVRPQYAISVGYVGTLGRDLLRILTPDQLSPYQLGFFASSFNGIPSLDPVSSLVVPVNDQQALTRGGAVVSRTLFSSTGASSYNSLQLQVRGNDTARGIVFGSALTYSHSIDTASDFFNLAGSYALPQDSLNPSERGSSNYDERLRWITHFVWEPLKLLGSGNPVAGSRCLDELIHGWTLAGVFTAQSGQPFTVNSAIDVNQDGNFTDRLGSTSGLLYGSAPGDSQAVLRLASNVATRGLLAPGLLSQVESQVSACEVSSSTGTYSNLCNGAVGRNTFRGARLVNLDVASTWSLYSHEGKALLFRTEVFNALNRASFALPVRMLEAPAFGRAVSTVTPARSIQLSLRLTF